jgi:hypothetical protein
MSMIIAGRFRSTSQVRAVLADLCGAYFNPGEFFGYYIDPPGKLGLYPLGLHPTGGDAHPAAGAPCGVGTGAAGLGAHAESFLRFFAHATNHGESAGLEPPVGAGAGPMVAICVDRPGTEQVARATLHRHGAYTIELQNGRWAEGGWTDFESTAMDDPVGHT